MKVSFSPPLWALGQLTIIYVFLCLVSQSSLIIIKDRGNLLNYKRRGLFFFKSLKVTVIAILTKITVMIFFFFYCYHNRASLSEVTYTSNQFLKQLGNLNWCHIFCWISQRFSWAFSCVFFWSSFCPNISRPPTVFLKKTSIKEIQFWGQTHSLCSYSFKSWAK